MFISILLAINFIGNFLLPEHPNLSWESPPSWVKNIHPAENVDAHPSQKGSQYLLADRQINLETSETFIRTVHKVLEGGVEDASYLEIEFDPSYETILLHQLAIMRDGKEIERLLPETRLLQRERSLESNVYNGRLSLIFLLHDVRKDDLIEIAYTRKGQNPVFEGHFCDLTLLSFSTKIEKFHYRVVHQKEHPLYFSIHNASFPMEQQACDDAHIESFLLLTPTSVMDISNTPYWYMPWPWLQMTDFHSWQEVAEWGAKLFQLEKKDSFNEVHSLVKTWTAQSQTKEDLILAILNFVQNDIRYLGIEESIYSHQPHNPIDTFSRRYGDCKDKTLLLKLFMDECGIDSTPCFVSTRYRDVIKDWLPSHNVFDHAILNISLEGQDYWLDPTQKYQGGSLKDYSQSFYGCYLPLSDKGSGMITLPCQWTTNELTVSSHYKIAADQNQLEVKAVYKGEKANAFRSELAYEGKEAIANSFKEYFSTLFGSAEPKEDLLVEDDQENNQITVVETYFLNDLLKDGKVDLKTLILADTLPSMVSFSRQDPVALNYPLSISESIRVSSDAPLGVISEKESFNHPALTCNYEVFKEGEDLVLNYHYTTKSDHILPEDFKSLRDTLSRFSENMFYTYKYSLPDPELPKDPGYEAWIGLLLIVPGAFFTIRAIRQRLSEDALQSHAIKNKWKTAFWVVFITHWLFLSIVLAIMFINNPLISLFLAPLFMVNLGWAFLLYKRSYQKNGTVILGITIGVLVLGVLNPLNLYLLIRSVQLYRYNRDMRSRSIIAYCKQHDYSHFGNVVSSI